MHEKEFSLIAKALPHMFARWRLPGDFETLADLADGEIVIDARSGTARHFQAGPIVLRIATELKAGLDARLAEKGIEAGEVREALVRVTVDTSKVRTDRNRIVHFDFRIDSRLEAGGGVFTASQIEDHVWHSRPDG